ncbi:Alginate lyase, PL17, partial [Clydaea vesicula]
IHQNSDVDRTADRNVRCVERVGQINLNSVGLRNGPWTVDMVNIITSEIVVSTTVYINNINKVDLSKFELHLPLSRKAGGKMSIINSLELRNGFSLPPYFYFDSITSAYVFHTPVWFDGAVTSSGSDYIRTELRQEANWNALLSQQTLTALQSVNSVSQNGVFVGQILADFNGKHSPVLYIGLKPNSANPSLYDLKAFVNEYNENSLKINTSTFILKSSYVLGTTFEIKIRVGQGAVSIYYNGDLKTVDYNTKFSSGIFGNVYYKTGSYGQTKRTDDLNINNQVSEVSIYKLEISN